MNKTLPQRWRGSGDATVLVSYQRELYLASENVRSKMRGESYPRFQPLLEESLDYAVEVLSVVLAMRGRFSQLLRDESPGRGSGCDLKGTKQRGVAIEYYQSWLRISVFILLRACLRLLFEE